MMSLLTAAAVAVGVLGCKDEPAPTPPAKPPTPATQAATPATQPTTPPESRPVATMPAESMPATRPTTRPSSIGEAPTTRPSGTAAIIPGTPGTGETPATPAARPALTYRPGKPGNVEQPPQSARVNGWYQWRGPEQNGISRETNLPSTWDPLTGENVVWEAPIGGMSSPVVWDGKLYTYIRTGEIRAGDADYPTLVPGPETQEALVCVDIANGEVLWKQAKNMTQTEVPFHRLGWSSPCVDPSTGLVYGLGSQATLECVDGKTGKVIWDRQMTEEFGMISTFGGRTPAPTIDEDQLFIAGISFGWGDHARSGHRIFAFDKKTGALNWSESTGGLPVDAPQNTPVIAVINGQRLVIFAAGDGGIHAFQPRTGKKVWTFTASKRGINTSVVVDGTKLYCSHGLDNFDVHELGRIFCIDMANLDDKGNPKEVWKVTGIEAAFPTSVVTDKWMYTVDDRGKLYQIDKTNGKIAWKKTIGHVGKPSPVFADGKLYIADGQGKFWIYEPEEKSAKTLSKAELPEKLGREYAIYGSPAIADGRVYLQTATKIYCIANKGEDGKEAPRKAEEYGKIEQLADEKPVEKDKPAQLRVTPYDVVLHPGDSVKLTARQYDANGRLIGEVPADKVKWEIAQLTIPPPPAARWMPKPEGAEDPKPANDDAKPANGEAKPPATGPAKPEAGDAGDSAAARDQLVAAAATQAAVGPAKAGNLKGSVDKDGTYKAEGGPHQGGAVEAKAGDLTAQARVRVLPPLPWKIDFQQNPVGKPPLTWTGAGGKFSVVEDPADKNNKALQKILNVDLYYKARTNFGSVDMTEYTLQGDVKAESKEYGGTRQMPDAGIINSRYVLVLLGTGQKAQLHVWPSALPDDRNPFGAIHSTKNFKWDPKKWYRLKLQVTQEGPVAVARGKVWVAGEQEPKDWLLELKDTIPNRSGNPGVYGNSLVIPMRSEIWYDNLVVTANNQAAEARAGFGPTEQNK